MKFVIVEATDGTPIPVLAQLVGVNAIIKVEGDGSCHLNTQDEYLVTVINDSKGKALADKASYKGKEFAVDKVKDVGKEEVVQPVLKAMGLKKAAVYLVRGLEILSAIPMQVVTAVFFDAEDTGEAKEGAYRQPLPNGQSALIRWIGEPS